MSGPKSEFVREMIQDRDTALLSLDEAQIRAYAAKYNVPLPENMTVFWLAIHKARASVTTFPASVREQSIAWLKEHGSEAL
jgi:hypothetical protein